MKVLVIGLSPNLVTSRGKLSSMIMKYLYVNSIPVSGLVWGHDTNYFVPDDDGKFYYKFPLFDLDHKIPITPFNRGENESIVIYETIKLLDPDVVLTIGDYTDFLYMKAVKSFCNNIKWIWVLSNYSSPINENNRELVNDADGVLCTSEYGYNSIKSFCAKSVIEYCYVGTNPQVFQPLETNKNKIFKVMVAGKNSQADNLPIVFESVANARRVIPEIQLYVHTNLYDSCGEYDLEQLKYRFDPNDEFIRFPEKCISIFDGAPQKEIVEHMSSSDVFISVPIVSATSMSIFDAMACGCFPIVSDCGSNRDVINLFCNYAKNRYKSSDFLVKCSKLMAPGGTYLYVCDPDDLTQKIINANNNKGDKEFFAQFTYQHTREGFLKKIVSMLTAAKESGDGIMCLEKI